MTTKKKTHNKADQKQPKDKMRLLTLELVRHPFLVTSRDGERKFMKLIRTMRRLSVRIRKKSKFSQFRRTLLKVAPIKRLTLAVFQWQTKRSCKSRTNSPTYTFLQLPNQEHQRRHEDSTPFKDGWQIFRDKVQLQQKEKSQNKSRLQFFWRQFQQWSPCKDLNPIRREKKR